MFTDGCAPDPRRLEAGAELRCGWVYFCLLTGEVYFGTHAPTAGEQAHWEPRETQVIMTEALAPIAALCALRRVVHSRRILLLVDSEAVEGAFIKGDSPTLDLRLHAGLFWHICLLLDLAIYVDRVPTDGNPADDPSRGHLDGLKRRGATLLPSDTHLSLTEALPNWEGVEVMA